MPRYRTALPQLNGDVFLTDAGLETDLIFNHQVEIREFAAHTLLPDPAGRAALTQYYRGFLDLARELGTGFIVDSQTWKAHRHWAQDLGAGAEQLRQANHDSIAFIAALREEYNAHPKPIVLNAVIGPCGDAYAPETVMSADAAESYHAEQLGWLAETEVDMVSALTFPLANEAAGFANAANQAGLPCVISFTVETDGRLADGQPLNEAIEAVDAATGSYPAYFMINCAHPDHFASVLTDAPWLRRIRGVRANASRKSHEELDNSDTLDAGDPIELAAQYRELHARMPWLNVFGGCCGSDLRHVTQIARALVKEAA